MREELDNKLCEKYPLIFAQRNGSMRETCMCWGFCCGDGWYNILDAMCANIQNHINWRLEEIKMAHKFNAELEEARANDFEGWADWKSREPRDIPEPVEQVVATQVKEKFGDLRFYYTGGDALIDGVVRMAESMSGRTCEECGAPGTHSSSGWIRTLCEEHNNAST
jgi:hypothetical protein